MTDGFPSDLFPPRLPPVNFLPPLTVVHRRPGMRFIATMPAGLGRVTEIVPHLDRILVRTQSGVCMIIPSTDERTARLLSTAPETPSS